ncbi:MAG: hypothetical protein H6Q30_538 [Bacteroidetes bacterium]|nr:hypothetical protein [Bacteroidota bacterium]
MLQICNRGFACGVDANMRRSIARRTPPILDHPAVEVDSYALLEPGHPLVLQFNLEALRWMIPFFHDTLPFEKRP